MTANKKVFEWAVVGAGPAGIASVGKLMDRGIAGSDILWIDPRFEVGDLGYFWRNVSSNTTVGRFTDFLKNSSSFSYAKAADSFALKHLNPNDTCQLSEVVVPLQWVSNQLKQQVHCDMSLVHSMHLSERLWHLSLDSQSYRARNTILATGAVSSSLNYPGVDVMPFDVAIDKERLIKNANPSNTYAVFGSSHSAIIIIRNLVEIGVKKIINFYRSPCKYAIDLGEWILFDNTGLKGNTASWAREHIDGILPPNLVRYTTSEKNIARYLPECSQVIYAVGFERRNNIVFRDYQDTSYNQHLGIIGPGLFGLGIAYPQIKADPFGSFESQVGLWKFMVYLNSVLPLWFKYHT